jgi:hypothetical protein
MHLPLSQPLHAFPSSSNQREDVQDAIAQLPFEQVLVALDNEQTLPHAPQFLASVWILTSHLLALLPSQSAKPVGHAFWDIAGVATTKNTMAGKSMSIPDNIRYCFVITASLVASVILSSLPRALHCHCPVSYMGVLAAISVIAGIAH